jgi:Luciferase
MLRQVKNEAVAEAEAVARIRREVGGWLGITIEPGMMPASVEFQFRGRVLGQVYPVLGGLAVADLIVPPAHAEALVIQRRARRHAVVPALGWITIELATEADVGNAIALFRDSYERQGRPLRLV